MGAGIQSRRLGQEEILHASNNSTPPSHSFSRMVLGTRTERSALMMRSASLMNPFSKCVRITSGRKSY